MYIFLKVANYNARNVVFNIAEFMKILGAESRIDLIF